MEKIELDNKLSVEINDDAVEPHEYFKVLKGKAKKAEATKLQEQLNVLAENIIKAKKIGQKTYLDKLCFTYATVIKEQQLLVNGIDKFVYKDDVKHLIENVTPKNSIKIIELERYPRAIPLDVMERIDEIKEKKIFDDFVVVFTDFTDNDYSTPEEKEIVQRNKDPIVFGVFRVGNNMLVHDRFYFVADWEDEFCDLTFTRMIEKMSELGLSAERNISTDVNYLNEVVYETVESIKLKNRNGVSMDVIKPKRVSWFKRIFKWRK